MDPPRTLATGARRVPIVLIRVGDQQYPWGVERTDAQALDDDDFIQSLIGLPVKIGIDDVAHPGKVRVGVEDGSEKAGVIVSARFDADEQAIVGEIVLDEVAGLQALARGVRGASLSYDVEMDPTPIAEGIHRRRRLHSPDHVLLTRMPRGGSMVGVRSDSAHRSDACEIDVPPEARTDNANGGTVEGFDPTKWPEYSARMDATAAGLEALKGRCDAYDALAGRMDAMDEKMGPMLKKWAEQEAAEPEHRADSAGVWRSILAAADAHKVEIAADASLADARKAVGAAVVGKERADALSADALDIAIEMAGKRQDSRTGFTFADLAAQSRSVPADGAGRQDSDNASPLRGA
jgi:hypothetical protein